MTYNIFVRLRGKIPSTPKSFYPKKKSDSELFAAAFNTSHYIHISRKDKIAQAVSLLKAEQSGLWHIHPDRTERERLKQGHTPIYDEKALLKFVTELKDHDRAWLKWLKQLKISPISITYEELSADPQSKVANILFSLGIDSKTAKIVKPRTAKLSNNESREWAERFRANQLK